LSTNPNKSEEPKGLRLVIFRSYAYFLQGFSFVSLPLQIIGFSSAIYLVIKEFLPFGYSIYMGLIIGLGVPAIVILGWTIYNKTHFYAQQQTVQNYQSPYAHFKLNPINFPIWRLYRELALSLNNSELAKEIDEILRKNGTN